MIRTFVATVLLAAGLSAVPATAADAQACRPSLTKVSLARSVAIGGTSVRGRVILSCAPARAVTVHLFGFRGVKVPSTVRVAKAKRTAAFAVTTYRTRTVRKGVIAASFGGVRKTAALAVRPDPCRPTLKAFTVPSRVYAGSKGTGTVRLTCAPRSSTTLALRSADSRLRVPTQVTVRAGRASAPVSMSAALVDGDQYRTSLTVRYGTKRLTRSVVVNPGLREVDISPSSDLNSFDPTVCLTGSAPAGGLTVRLAADNARVRVPQTLAVAAGARCGRAWFVDVVSPTIDTRVTVLATLGSRTVATTKVLLAPFDGTQRMSMWNEYHPGPVYGGEDSVQYSLWLSHPAPAAGLSATLKVRDDHPAVWLDSPNDYLSEGDNRGAFRATFADVTSTTHVVLEATVAGATFALPVAIHPRIDTITIPESAPGGTPFTGTVTMRGPSEVDTVVYLQSSWGILDVPSSVTIPAGSTSATFEARPSTVSEPSSVDIIASLGDTRAYSNPVTITP